MKVHVMGKWGPPNRGSQVPIFTIEWGPGSLLSQEIGEPSHKNGDPQFNTLLDIYWTAWLSRMQLNTIAFYPCKLLGNTTTCMYE